MIRCSKALKVREDKIALLRESAQFPQAPAHQTDTMKSEVEASPSTLSALEPCQALHCVPLCRYWPLQVRDTTCSCALSRRGTVQKSANWRRNYARYSSALHLG